MSKYIPEEGYIYCMKNEMHDYYGKDTCKLGKAVDLNSRMNGYTTSYVESCEYTHSLKVSDCCKAEKILFDKLKHCRIKARREFFKPDKKALDEAFKYLKILNNDNKINEVYDKIEKTKDTKEDKIKRLLNSDDHEQHIIEMKNNLLERFKIKEEECNYDFLKSWIGNESKFDNALTLYSGTKADDKLKTKLKYLKEVMEVYGFNKPFDFKQNVKSSEEMIQRMKDKDWLEKEKYKEIKSFTELKEIMYP